MGEGLKREVGWRKMGGDSWSLLLTMAATRLPRAWTVREAGGQGVRAGAAAAASGWTGARPE